MTGTAAKTNEDPGGSSERSMAALRALATGYAVHLDDVLLLALNLWGVSTHAPDGRVRAEVRVGDDASPEWHVIVPSGRDSPLAIDDETLLFDNVPVGVARKVEHDDARLGYVRGEGAGLTLNTNRRSSCVGCVFCPNTIADAGDPRSVASAADITSYLKFICVREQWRDLSSVAQVNLSTGCFGTADRAIEHLGMVRQVLDSFGFTGRLGILSSVIRSSQDFERMRSVSGECALFLTLECLERRDIILKDTKADLTPEEAIRLLARARAADVNTGVTLIVGLDQPESLVNWLRAAAPCLTDFPNLQVYQAHSPLMEIFRHPGADTLAFMLKARHLIEQISLDARPVWWQNFRPLWHRHYGDTWLR